MVQHYREKIFPLSMTSPSQEWGGWEGGGRRGGTAGGRRSTICYSLIVSAALLIKSNTSVNQRRSWTVTITEAYCTEELKTDVTVKWINSLMFFEQLFIFVII